MSILIYVLMTVALVILLFDYRSGIVTVLMVMTNFGEIIYVNPNLEIGDFGGVGTIYFMDIFWLAVIIVIFLKKDKLALMNYKFSVLLFGILILISLIIPFIINSYSIKDIISVIRPLGNFLLLPYFVVTIIDITEFNFFEKVITVMVFTFLFVQIYEYIMQKRIPVRVFESNSMFYGEDPFSVEFGGIKTGYIWSRITYLLPFNLFFGCYYFFKEKRNYGLLLIAMYVLSVMITLSRIWIIGFAFFMIVITLFILFGSEKKYNVRVKLFAMIGTIAFAGFILLYTSSTFNQIFDIFLLRINSINDLADKTDSSFIGREYILLQMLSVWWEYPVFGAGFSSISRSLVTNDLGIPNLITIFGVSGLILLGSFIKQYYNNIKIFIKYDYILFVSLISVVMMVTFMSIFSIDMFYFNATGAIIFAMGNILLNIGKQESTENAEYSDAA
ncbi:MAG TPA: O-antigen ligase family protein [Ignavibacteria bacterium]|nr:O-antigen ligase family protein [Ignavibacteria bacterium]HMR39847.1 O-antigen ligase family protein [Ignavibacteria bacterium]